METQRRIDEQKSILKNTKVVTRGQLDHFFANPDLSSLEALQKCLFAFSEQYDSLVEMSEKPEDLAID